MSAPAEPFRAELALQNVPGSLPLSALQVRLASPQAYRESGDTFPRGLEELRMVSAVMRGSTLVATLEATGAASVGPLRLRIEVTWPSGRQASVYEVALQAGASAWPLGRADDSSGVAGTPLVVQPGDTLSGIAARVRGADVSLNQMMVALYRANPRAFSGNVNVLRAGAQLRVPGGEAASQVNPEDAAVFLRQQEADFLATRQKLAMAPTVAPESEARRLAGVVQAPPADPKPDAGRPVDRLTLAAPSASASVSSTPDLADRISVQAAAEEVRRREAETVKLNEMLRQLQQERPHAASSGVVAATPAAAVVASAASTPLPVAAQALEQGLLEQPWLVPAALGLVLVVLVVGVLRLMRPRRAEAPETTFLPSQFDDDPALTSSSAFGPSTTGGGYAPTAPGAEMTLEQALSQFDASGEIDPVAEADVYLAYGRDRQAQEILTEAMHADPAHLGVQVKLLEIFAMRREVDLFTALARRLRVRSGGEGAHWAKARAMGETLGVDVDGGAASEQSRLDALSRSRFAVTQPAEEEPAPTRPQAYERPDPEKAFGPGSAFVDTRVPLDVSLDADERLPEPSTPEPRSKLGEADDLNPAQDLLAPVGGLHLMLEEAGSPAPESTPAAETLERKLALAEEFRLIGDPEAAKDLLAEVLARGDAGYQARAKAALERLG